MADTVTIQTIGSWEAEGVTVGQIEGALSELRRHEERAAVRTSVLTLVVVVHDPEAAATALDVVRQLGARHPARTLVLRLDDAGGAEQAGAGRGFDASVGVHVIDHDGRAVCFEDVTLAVRGRARHHLDSLVEPFTLPDLPVVVWVPDRLPGTGDPLLDAADRVIVDSRAAPDDRQVLPRLAGLVRRLPVTDLSWVRLAPWRHLLAAVFDDPTHTPFLGSVQGAEVVGRHGPRHLLAGWLASRLRLPRARLHLDDGPHASIRLSATHEGRTGRFSVERTGAEREIHTTVEIEGREPIHQTLRLRERAAARVLGEALTQMGADVTYAEAVQAAAELLVSRS